jgi:hypothetical protein
MRLEKRFWAGPIQPLLFKNIDKSLNQHITLNNNYFIIFIIIDGSQRTISGNAMTRRSPII